VSPDEFRLIYGTPAREAVQKVSALS